MTVFGMLIFAIWLGLPILAIWQILSARRRFVEVTCPECDYDLTGASVGSPCPECGIIPSIFRSKRPHPDRVLCRNCGQDLEGLQWDADCPECGLRSAALPKFQPRRSAFRIRALLGGVLLAIWLGLTTMIVIDRIDAFRYQQMRARARQVMGTAAQQTSEPSEATVTEPDPGDRD